MARHTMVLKNVVEMEKGDVGLDDYPIFDEAHRDVLNQKILNHFWNQEIGQETISMFRFALRRKMHEIMPLYNQHYVLSKLEVDPLSTISIENLNAATGESTGTTNGATTSNSNSVNESISNAESRAVASDTPQTALQENADYATSMQDNVSGSTAKGEATDSNTATANQTSGEKNATESSSKTNGYSGHAPLLIMQTRQALVNVDMMVIEQLKDLFMLVWSNDDSYTQNNRFGRYGNGYSYF